MERYPHLFSKGRIGNLDTGNRIKYAATETNFPYGDGYVSDREVAYMEAQAKGGAGIVTTQGAYPDANGEGKGFKGMMAIYDDRFIPGLARISEVIKKNGALSCIQILHCGREGGVELDYCLMPSVVPQKLSYFKKPREITAKEIKQALNDHVKAARRAVNAGFDMIELSGIVGYLISTFISSYTNKRHDEYNGDIRARCKLMTEILQGVKAEVGDKVPVGIRLCGLELLNDRGGNTIEESIESFKIAEEAGADYVSVTIGWHESSISVITRDVPMGHWLWVAGKVREAVNIPVMMAFRQFVPEIPEKAIAEGKIDYWEACRPMIADPMMPLKAKQGREDEIIPCIACNMCFSRLYYHQPIMCTVRPSLGHENETEWGYYGFQTSTRKKRIIVLGGGPAGLQCAVVLSKKGHDVSVWEKGTAVGGNILLASKVDDGASELLRPIRYLEKECLGNGVKIELQKEGSVNMFADQDVDIAVVASGAFPDIPSCLNGIHYFTPEEVFQNKNGLMKNILILGGDGVGIGTAVYLLNHGDYEVTIIEESTNPGRDVNPFYMWQYIRLLKEKKANIVRNAKIISIGSDAVQVQKDGRDASIEYGSMIIAKRIPAQKWERQGLDITCDIYYIGDAKKPRRLNNAIHDGYRLGMVIE